MVEKPREQMLYIIRGGETIKVGISFSPWKRLKNIQVGCPMPLRMLSIYACKHATQLERAIHHSLKAHREIGEWFKIECYPALVRALENDPEIRRVYAFEPNTKPEMPKSSSGHGSIANKGFRKPKARFVKYIPRDPQARSTLKAIADQMLADSHEAQ